jgi:hypothetical protein
MAQEGKTMIGTEIWRASPIRRADGIASAVSSTDSGRRRMGVRLWALLHAPALLGSIGGPGDVAFMEDDRRRLAAPAGEVTGLHLQAGFCSRDPAAVVRDG